MLDQRDRARLSSLLLIMIAAVALVGLLQLSGAGLNNPFVNDTPGQASGTFANRNHFALLLALGCLIVPVWAFHGNGRAGWRLVMTVGLLLIFLLSILGSGSRMGLVLAGLALALGLLMVRHPLRLMLRSAPRWVYPALVAGGLFVFAGAVLASIVADRAVSISRVFAFDAGDDMRIRALPTVLSMIGGYFPIGAGFGSFDPVFRIHEPFALLKLTYFNHAHNDWLETVLDGGLPAAGLLLVTLGWWTMATVRVWRATISDGIAAARLGSAMLLLIFIASAFDYPARTPIIMAVIVIAGLWLNQGLITIRRSALPDRDQLL